MYSSTCINCQNCFIISCGLITSSLTKYSGPNYGHIILAGKVIYEEDELVFCTIIDEYKFCWIFKIQKFHMGLLLSTQVASIIYTINEQYFYALTKNMTFWVCHITISRAVWCNWHWHFGTGSLGSISATKQGKSHAKVRQVDGSNKLHTLWPVKYCAKAGVSNFSLTCKLLH